MLRDIVKAPNGILCLYIYIYNKFNSNNTKIMITMFSSNEFSSTSSTRSTSSNTEEDV